MKRRGSFSILMRNTMNCLCSGDQMQVNKITQSTEFLSIKDVSVDQYTQQNSEIDQRVDIGKIEEAESSLHEGLCLNYEEARALLGRLEYQKGNVDVALHVFDIIDLASVAPKIKYVINKRMEHHKNHTNWDARPMSIHVVGLLVEAMYLKARALQDLRRFKGFRFEIEHRI